MNYATTDTPANYRCGECGASGVRLFRLYQTMLEWQRLYCTECAEKDQGREQELRHPHEIGWLVAAVPTEDEETYWGYTSVPQAGVEWWERLPRREASLAPAPEGTGEEAE